MLFENAVCPIAKRRFSASKRRLSIALRLLSTSRRPSSRSLTTLSSCLGVAFASLSSIISWNRVVASVTIVPTKPAQTTIERSLLVPPFQQYWLLEKKKNLDYTSSADGCISPENVGYSYVKNESDFWFCVIGVVCGCFLRATSGGRPFLKSAALTWQVHDWWIGMVRQE